MRLNQEWTQEWQDIEVPIAKVNQRIEQGLATDASKYKSFRERTSGIRSWIKGHQLATGVITYAALMLVVMLAVNNLGTRLTSDQAVNMDFTTEEQAPGVSAYKDGIQEDKAESEATPGTTAGSETSLNSGKMVQFYTFTKTTTNFSRDQEQIQAMLQEAGGYMETANVSEHNGGGTLRTGDYAMRVPIAAKEAFLKQLGEIGETVDEQITTENHSLIYSDNESRIEALETEEAALLGLLEKSEKMEDMLKIQERLATIRSERKSLVRTNQLIDNQVEYTSINLTLREISKSEKNQQSDSVATRIQNNWQQQLVFWQTFFKNVGVWLGSNLIYLLLSLVGSGLIFWFYRRKRNR